MGVTGRTALAGVAALASIALGCRSRPLDQGGGSGTFRLDAGGEAGGGGAGGGDGNPGTPRPLPLGVACSASSQCSSGFCDDAVCCNRDCGGPCVSCAAPGTVGTCVSVPAGMLGRSGDCPVELPQSCGRDGTCDGSGACRLWGLGTTCVPGQCESDAIVGAKICDGRGNCRTGPTQICAPYTCDPGTSWCRTDCTTDEDCPGSTCEPTGRCHIRIGVSCQSGSECATGFCAQRVCCNSACAAPCMSCNVQGREGTCSPMPGCTVDAGTD